MVADDIQAMPTSRHHRRPVAAPARGRTTSRQLGGGVTAAVLASAAIVLVAALWGGFAYRSRWRDWFGLFEGAIGGRSAASRERSAGGGLPGVKNLGNGRYDFGEFTIRSFDPVTKTTLRSQFRLEARSAMPDDSEFERFMQGRCWMLREQVLVALRGSNLEELTEPEQGLVERKVVSRVNRSFGQRVLDSVDLKDFELTESVEKSSFVPLRADDEEEVDAALTLQGS